MRKPNNDSGNKAHEFQTEPKVLVRQTGCLYLNISINVNITIFFLRT